MTNAKNTARAEFGKAHNMKGSGNNQSAIALANEMEKVAGGVGSCRWSFPLPSCG